MRRTCRGGSANLQPQLCGPQGFGSERVGGWIPMGLGSLANARRSRYVRQGQTVPVPEHSTEESPMFRPSSIRARAALLVALYAASTPLLAQERKSDSLFTVEKFLDFEQVADPQIAPDGSQIIYTRRHVNKLEDRFDAELWIVNADGS